MTDKSVRYQMTEDDIAVALKYLQTNENSEATREDAIVYLENLQSMSHLAAHKMVDDEMDGTAESSES